VFSDLPLFLIILATPKITHVRDVPCAKCLLEWLGYKQTPRPSSRSIADSSPLGDKSLMRGQIRREGWPESMRRAALMAVVGSVLVVAFAGVALAAGVIHCTGGRCEGTNRNDTFVGTNRVDLIFTKDGEDRGQANNGADELHGGNGDDDLAGEAGNDTYFGGKGRDFLSETQTAGTDDDGNDVINGGDGPDVMRGGREADILNGQDGSDALSGDPGNDELRGGPGPDRMGGDRDKDKHFGGRGNDFIDASFNDSANDPADLVVCGPGIDEAVVRPHDVVHKGCENVEVRE
jgi:hypothetical protein